MTRTEKLKKKIEHEIDDAGMVRVLSDDLARALAVIEAAEAWQVFDHETHDSFTEFCKVNDRLRAAVAEWRKP